MHLTMCAQCDVFDIRVCRLYGMNLTSVLMTRSSSIHLRACIEAKGGHFEHKLKRLVQNDRLHECFTFCKKICQVLTILHQLICRGVANFGTRCIWLMWLDWFSNMVYLLVVAECTTFIAVLEPVCFRFPSFTTVWIFDEKFILRCNACSLLHWTWLNLQNVLMLYFETWGWVSKCYERCSS